jgi:hypothetical protein
MKAGPHAGEGLDAIIARKQQETASAGWCLWGYGGSACHPLTQVQPHARSALPSPVTVVFIETASTPAVNSSAACEYSADAREWMLVPEGHRVTGSKWALVLRGLARTCQRIDLGACQVAVGPSAGKNLAAYLRGRCDKACAIPAGTPGLITSALVIATAELAPPYSVFLRLAEPAPSVTAAHRPSRSYASARRGPRAPPATGITGPPRSPRGPPDCNELRYPAIPATAAGASPRISPTGTTRNRAQSGESACIVRVVSMVPEGVKWQPSKLVMRVRFPSPALIFGTVQEGNFDNLCDQSA